MTLVFMQTYVSYFCYLEQLLFYQWVIGFFCFLAVLFYLLIVLFLFSYDDKVACQMILGKMGMKGYQVIQFSL